MSLYFTNEIRNYLDLFSSPPSTPAFDKGRCADTTASKNVFTFYLLEFRIYLELRSVVLKLAPDEHAANAFSFN